MKLYDAQHLMLDEKVFNVTTLDADVSAGLTRLATQLDYKPHWQMLGRPLETSMLWRTSHSPRSRLT